MATLMERESVVLILFAFPEEKGQLIKEIIVNLMSALALSRGRQGWSFQGPIINSQVLQLNLLISIFST
jgi:hypothetical protein